MTKLIAFLLSAGVLAAAAGQKQTFTGVITDTMCGADHKSMKISPDPKCVKDCVRMDKRFKYALYDGKKLYTLSDQQTPEAFAGEKVKVTGVLYEKTGIIRVESMERANHSH